MYPNNLPQDTEQPFKLNPRAPPFLPGAIRHPPLLTSNSPPPYRGLDFIQNALRPARQQYAPRVAHPAPLAAPNQYAYHVHPGYPHYTSTSELPTEYLPPARGNAFTQAGYNGGYQDGVSQVGAQVVDYPEAYQATTYGNRPPPYFFDGNVLWSAGMYGYGWPQWVQGVQGQQHDYQEQYRQQQQHGYQQHDYQQYQQQYVYAASPQHAADHFARKTSKFGGMKGKANKAWQKKGRGDGWRGA